ncbi:MAG TPA: hypothetical protein VH482_34035 [Thermomicrobiales bacterium]
MAPVVLLLLLGLEPIVWGKSQVACGDMTPSAASTPRPDPPYLILLQRSTTETNTNRTPYILANLDYIESLPFDGMVVNIPASWDVMRGRPLAYQHIYDHWLAPLQGKFTHFTQNFVEVMIDDPGDVFDDAAWQVTVDNWRLMARAARQAGFVGIFFDNEEYTGRWLDYPEDYTNPTHTLDEYRAQTRLRGTQIMQAIVAEFPNVVFLTYHGPYVSEPKTPLSVIAGQSAAGDASDLTGALFTGFLEGLGPQAQLIDGGEVYAYRTADDFAHSYAWRKTGLPSAATDSAFISPADRAVWSQRVGISYGVYNLTFPPHAPTMTPQIMRTTLEQALRHADRYVWYYTYIDNWLIPGDMPHCWFNAVEGARAAVGDP